MNSQRVKEEVVDYLLGIGDVASQALNTAVFLGNSNETVSGRCYRLRNIWFWGVLEKVIDLAFYLFQKQHCKRAHLMDTHRAQRVVNQARGA